MLTRAEPAIDNAVLCERVLGWKIAHMEGRDDFWTKPGDRGSWSYQNTIEKHTPEFSHDSSAVWGLMKAACKKWDLMFRADYDPEGDAHSVMFYEPKPVCEGGRKWEADAAEIEAAITQAVWALALVQEEGE